MIDFSFEPEVLVTTTPPGPNYAWVAILVVFAALAGLALYAYFNQRELTEWLLWRLSSMRFTKLTGDGSTYADLDFDNERRDDDL